MTHATDVNYRVVYNDSDLSMCDTVLLQSEDEGSRIYIFPANPHERSEFRDGIAVSHIRVKYKPFNGNYTERGNDCICLLFKFW